MERVKVVKCTPTALDGVVPSREPEVVHVHNKKSIIFFV